MKRKVVAYVAIVISLVYVLLVFLYGYVFWKVKQLPSSPLPFFWREGQGESSLILVDHQYPIFKIPIEEMKIDLSALTNAVEILPLPETEIQRLALAHCKTWGYPSLQAHQHNLELLLPDFLVATQKLFRPSNISIHCRLLLEVWTSERKLENVMEIFRASFTDVIFVA